MEVVPEHPEEEREPGADQGDQEETAFQQPTGETKQQAPLKKVSSTTSRGSGSTSSAPGPGGRRRSRKGSIFVADEPFADSLTAYVPEEPDDDVFELK